MNESDTCLQEGLNKVGKINTPLDFHLILNLVYFNPVRKLTLPSPLELSTLRPCHYVAFDSPCILFLLRPSPPEQMSN